MGAFADERSLTGAWTRLIHKEAFSRMHLGLEIVTAPAKRLNIMAEQGELDGQLARSPTYGLEYPDMVAVDEALMEVSFSIYTAKPMPGLTRLEDLRDRNLSGSYARGVLVCEKALAQVFAARRLTPVQEAKNGLAMLALGRIDFYCDASVSVSSTILSAAGRKGLQPHKLFELGPKVPARPYLAAKHAALAPAFAATLKQMKAEGLFERYWLEAEKQLE